MPTEPTLAAVEGALGRVVDPCSIATGVPISLPEMGLIQGIEISDGTVAVTLRLTSPVCLQSPKILAAVEERLLELDGVRKARCEVDPGGEWLPSMISERARKRRARFYS